MLTSSNNTPRIPDDLYTLRPEQNGHHFAVIFSNTLLEWKVLLLTQLSLKFVPTDPIDNKSALVQVMARRQVITWTNYGRVPWRMHWNEKVVKLTALGQSLNLILNDDYPGIPSDYPGSQLECRGSRKLRVVHAPFLASGTASVADILFTDRQSPIYGNPLNPRQVLIFESGLIWHHCFRITPAVFCNVFEISKLVLEATKICERSGQMPNQRLTFRGFISLSWKGVL